MDEREQAVRDDPDLLAALERAIEQASRGLLVDRGSFAEFLDDDE